MSISYFTGGLEWQEEEIKETNNNQADQGAESTDLNKRDINEFFNPRASTMSLDDRYRVCCEVGEEILKEQELMELLKKKETFRCYDGFEPSGRMHIAQGIMKAINVNKITSAGGIFIFWVADWFALLNNKMGGDLHKIQVVGRYFVEVWKAAGMNLNNVQFLWASEEINKRPDEYWSIVMDIARKNNVTRIKKCSQIMGRADGDDMPSAQIMYPCMQCADIFFLKADVCQLGLDQRKVNVLAKEYCDVIKKKEKPVVISHHMLSGLKQGQEKMSKSDPDSAIFMEDTAEDVARKIKRGYCPEKTVTGNPIMDYCKNICFLSQDFMEVQRREQDGGKITYNSYEELEADFTEGKLHPSDLKPAVANVINQLLQPVRDHFQNDEYAKKLLETIKKWQAEAKTHR